MHFRHCRACGASMSASDATLLRDAARHHAGLCRGAHGMLFEWQGLARRGPLRRAR